MPKLPLPAAAKRLGIAYSTLHRRITLVGMTTESDEHGQTFIDTDELERRWNARPTKPRTKPRGGLGGALNVTIDKETRDELDELAERHETSLADVTRAILQFGLTAYYERGRRLDD